MEGHPEMSQRIKRFLKLALFAITIVLIVFMGVLPIGGAYLYINFMLNRDCGNLETPLSERLSDPTGLQAFTFEPQPGLVLDSWYQPGTNGAGIIVLPGAYGG